MPKLWSKESRSMSIMMPGLVQDLDISEIRNSKYLFRTIARGGNLEELCASIQKNGLLHPVIVRSTENHYETVAGNRRVQACKILGCKKIACHVMELDDKQSFEISLIENLQRRTLSPLEEAAAFKTYVSDFGWGGISNLSMQIGKSVSYITKKIKLLNLPANIHESIINHKIEVSLAEELLSIKDKDKQSMLADIVSKRKLSLRMTRKLVKSIDEIEIDFLSTRHIIDESTKHYKLVERSFDKSISAIRIAMNSLGEIINTIEDDWVLYEILMQHKNMLHTQIDILLKQKRKL